MKVSIITACHNRAKTMPDTIKSVLTQDYPDIEYIIVDGASTDGTIQIVKQEIAHYIEHGETELIRQHAREVKFISEPDHSMYEALNKGIRMATGDVVGHVHSDDMLVSDDIVSAYVRHFEKTGADMVYADGFFVDPDQHNQVKRIWRSGNYHRWKVRIGWLPLHTTMYMKRSVLMADELYREDLRTASDTFFLIHYLYETKIKVSYMPKMTMLMRMGGLSTDASRRKQVWDEDVSILEHYGFWPAPFIKMCKMAWKVPQVIEPKFRR